LIVTIPLGIERVTRLAQIEVENGVPTMQLYLWIIEELMRKGYKQEEIQKLFSHNDIKTQIDNRREMMTRTNRIFDNLYFKFKIQQ